MKSTRYFLILLLSGLLAVGPPAFFGSDLHAKSLGGGRSSGSRSFGKSAPWSPSTHGTWNRSGGGMFGDKQSTDYAKPSLNKQTTPATIPKTSGQEAQGSSGYSKPSSSTGSGTSGYAKPSLGGGTGTETAKPLGGASSGGYAKPSHPGAGQQSFSGGSKFDKETIAQERKQRSQESLQAYKAEQSKFKNPEVKADASKYESNPLYQKGKVYSGFDYRSQYASRDNFYRGQGYHAPAYAFNSSPSFGMFDTLFLFWMLNNVGNKNVAATAYHHADDPGFQKWRQEVEEQAKTNSDLKAKLTEMDKQIKSMEGTPKDPAYLPKGVPTDVALAAPVLASKAPEKPVVRFATGQSGGWYNKAGDIFKGLGVAKNLDVQLIPTSGSLDNLNLLAEGKADLALVQSDALALMQKKQPDKKMVSEQAELYVEYAQLIANRDGGVTALKDLDSRKHFVYVGPKGSGTAITWEGLCEQDPRLKRILVKYDDYGKCLIEVRKNPKALMMFVGALNSEWLKLAEQEAERSGKLRLVAIQDSQFADKVDKHGNKIYKFVEIPSDIYPALQKGWLFSGAVKTLGVQAVLVLRTEWAEKYGPVAMDAMTATLQEAKTEIRSLVDGSKVKTGYAPLVLEVLHASR
jgi:TRAP transporter TAXI family solute receptor